MGHCHGLQAPLLSILQRGGIARAVPTYSRSVLLRRRLAVLSADPWGMEAAVGAGAESGLGVPLGRSCLEVCFCLLNSDLGAAREAEGGQREQQK